MSRMPFEIASIITIDFLPAFIGTFAFYTLLCYTIAKVIAFFISQLSFSAMHTVAALTLRLRKQWPQRFNRSASKTYRDANKYESPTYSTTLIVIFLLLFNVSYLELLYTKVSSFAIFLTFITILAIVLKIGFLARSPARVMRRLLDKKRVAYRRQLGRASIYLGASLVVALAYYAGILRFEKLQNESPTNIKSDFFEGSANILLKSGNSFLALRKTENTREYIFFSEHNSISLAIENKTAKVPNGEAPGTP